MKANNNSKRSTSESQTICCCSRIGGHKIDEIAKLILRKLFSDELAALYSWMGAKRKRVFSHLILAEVILNSVRAHNIAANATDKEIIDSIKNWLRHASTRNKNNTERKSRDMDRLEENTDAYKNDTEII